MVFLLFFIFLAVVGILMVLVYASGPKAVDMGDRLSRTLKARSSEQEEGASSTAGRKAENVFVAIGAMLPKPKAKKLSQDQTLLIRAGYRSPNAYLAMRGARVISCILLIALVVWTGLSKLNPFAVILIAGFLGAFAPEFWVLNRVKARQKVLRLALPDAMDLMVICVEVGLGLDHALLRVAEEIGVAHPELASELQMVNLEMRVGRTRLDALRELGERTGLDDLKALAGILVQTDRFGTSIVQALRTYSDELRTKRRQRAEEMAAKVSVKMVPALVFFIFPALMVVILGPAVLAIMHSLLPSMK
jgi:tight adherence protein C